MAGGPPNLGGSTVSSGMSRPGRVGVHTRPGASVSSGKLRKGGRAHTWLCPGPGQHSGPPCPPRCHRPHRRQRAGCGPHSRPQTEPRWAVGATCSHSSRGLARSGTGSSPWPPLPTHRRARPPPTNTEWRLTLSSSASMWKFISAILSKGALEGEQRRSVRGIWGRPSQAAAWWARQGLAGGRGSLAQSRGAESTRLVQGCGSPGWGPCPGLIFLPGSEGSLGTGEQRPALPEGAWRL